MRVGVNGLLVFAELAVDPGDVGEHAALAWPIADVRVGGAGAGIRIQGLLVLAQVSVDKTHLEQRVRFHPAIADRLPHRDRLFVPSRRLSSRCLRPLVPQGLGVRKRALRSDTHPVSSGGRSHVLNGHCVASRASRHLERSDVDAIINRRVGDERDRLWSVDVVWTVHFDHPCAVRCVHADDDVDAALVDEDVAELASSDRHAIRMEAAAPEISFDGSTRLERSNVCGLCRLWPGRNRRDRHDDGQHTRSETKPCSSAQASVIMVPDSGIIQDLACALARPVGRSPPRRLMRC